MKLKPLILAVAISTLVAGCNNDDDDNDTSVVTPVTPDLTLTIAHLNDHHSKLDAENSPIKLADKDVKVDIGGYPRVVTEINRIKAEKDNVLKLHAGDAITGTMYYTLFKDEEPLPDAVMMNQVGYDAFVLGNHEFDGGNQQLSKFLRDLTTHGWNPAILSANVEVPAGDVLENTFEPYTLFDIKGKKVAVIGNTIAKKTMQSSAPDEGTVIHDEIKTTQKVIDQLQAEGIDKIIVLSHYGYAAEVEMAKKLRGVDVIVGGDSHTLLGNKDNFSKFGYEVEGDYPTIVNNADNNKACVVQAWESSRILGELDVSFDQKGDVISCSGVPHLLLGDNFTHRVEKDGEEVDEPVSEAERQEILNFIKQHQELTVVAKHQPTVEKLKEYKDKLTEKQTTLLGTAAAKLCNERVPGSNHSSGASVCGKDDPERQFMNQHGSIMAHIVSKAFHEQSIRSEIAIQNTGGVRKSIDKGDFTVGNAYDVLPFGNKLVNITMTGEEIINTMEDSIDFSINESDGAFPSAYNLRFDVDMRADKGKRVSEVEVKTEDDWKPIDVARTYVVVTNDYIASGKDGYSTMGKITENHPERVEDTGLLYTASLINYFEKKQEQTKAIEMPLAKDMSVQNYNPIPKP